MYFKNLQELPEEYHDLIEMTVPFLKVGYHLLKNELMNLMPIILLVRFWNCN